MDWPSLELVWFSARCSAAEGEAPGSQDDADVRAVLSGDGGRYTQIVRRHQRRLAAFLTRFSRDRDVVEELLQETFVRAHRALPTYRGPGSLGPWLAKIAVRVGYRYWRSRDRARTMVGAWIEWARGRRRGPAPESTDGVDRVLEALSARDRLVLTLLHMEQRSVEQTAFLTGWSESMVKVQAHRARERFRMRWKEMHDEQ